MLYEMDLCWCFLYTGKMRTELEVLRGVSSCDVNTVRTPKY